MQPTDDTTNGDHVPKLPERYRLIGELGQGGMSRVYRVHDDLLQKEVALKILHTDAQADPKKLVGFQREARITAQLNHQNIVSILDFGLTDEGNPYLVMDYVAGESLAEVLSRSGRLNNDKTGQSFDPFKKYFGKRHGALVETSITSISHTLRQRIPGS